MAALVLCFMLPLTACSTAPQLPAALNLDCPEWPPAPKQVNVTQRDIAIWLVEDVKPAFDECRAVVESQRSLAAIP